MTTFLYNLSENLFISDSVDGQRTPPFFGTAPKQVKGLLLNSSDDRRGVKTSWNPLMENATKYELYRIGAIVRATSNGGILAINDGDTLDVKVRGGKVQTITFSSTYITSGAATLSELETNINTFLQGARAYISQDPGLQTLYLRVDGEDQGAEIEVKGGTANAIFGFPTGRFSYLPDKSQAQKIADTLHPVVEFEDRDGSPKDWYYVRALNSFDIAGQNSVYKTLNQYIDEIPVRVIICGLIYDASGMPVENERVILRPPETNVPSLDGGLHSSFFGVSFHEHTVTTDADGYFETEAIADSVLRLTIPCIQYDQVVQIPLFSAKFTELNIVHGDFRTSTTTGLISGAIIGIKGKTELKIGDVQVINDENHPVPIYAPNPIEVFGNFTINVGSSGLATEATLAALNAKFVSGTDIGDVTINNTPLNPVPVDFPTPLPVMGTVDVGNFPATQDVEIVASIPLDVDLVPGAVVIANIGSTGGLALEATLAALNAKFVPSTTIGTVLIGNGAAGLAVNIQDGGNSITVDGGVNVLNDPFVKLQDALGAGITSTTVGPKQALDVNMAAGSVSVNLDHSTDDILIYGFDGAANQKVKTDAAGELQIDVLSSALPVGASTEATLAALNAKIPADPSREHITAVSPNAVRLTDGAAFYKATTPADTQPVKISQTGTDNDVDATIVNAPFVKLQDAAGTGLTSSLTMGRQALDVKVIDMPPFSMSHLTDDILVYGFDGAADKKLKTNTLGQLETMVVGTVLPPGAATEATLSAINTKIPVNPSLEHITQSSPHAARLTDGTNWLTSTIFGGVKYALDVNILGGTIIAVFPGDHADLDTDGPPDEHAVVAIGLPSPSGHVVGGTATNPFRIDPTGTTIQPVSLASVPLPTGAATEATLLVVEADTSNLDVLLSTRASEATLATLLTQLAFEARINTLGQKAMAASTPVVIASDQSPVSVSLAAGASGDYYQDNLLTPAAVGGVGTAFAFGFTAQNITIISDETTGGGAKDLEFSFDGFTTVHGILRKGESISMDNRRRSSINLRSVGALRAYRMIVWG